jgi:hypothetical protein
MKLFALFAKFGALFARKPEAARDMFDLRLERTRTREARRVAQPVLFRD